MDSNPWPAATRSLLAMLVFISLNAESARGQDAEVRYAVDQIFEGMRVADADVVRAVFSSETRFATMDTRNGGAVIRSQSVEGWLSAIDKSEGAWDEQIYQVQVLVDENMTSVWAPYTSYLNGEISHCGINSIELLKDSEGWKVTQLSDTRSEEACPDPLGG